MRTIEEYIINDEGFQVPILRIQEGIHQYPRGKVAYKAGYSDSLLTGPERPSSLQAISNRETVITPLELNANISNFHYKLENLIINLD